MDDNREKTFRPRVEETATGLAREEPARRPRTDGLEFIADKTGTFSEVGGLQLIPLADLLMPVSAEEIDTSAAHIDFGISSLLAEQRSERLTALLVRVQALIAE